MRPESLVPSLPTGLDSHRVNGCVAEAVLVTGSYCKEVAEMTSIVMCLPGPVMAKKQFREEEVFEDNQFWLGNVETEKNLK